MKRLAIIPARGGSVRIPRKNIKAFCGKPIIAYAIEAALQSGCFDMVMVSTEDQEIADIAQYYGASIPFKRSDITADNYATLADVAEEVLSTYQARGITFNYVCCMLATAPFITMDLLQQSYKRLIAYQADAIIPIVRFSYPIQRGLVIKNGFLTMRWPEHYASRTQDLEPTFHDAGIFYWLRVDSLLRQKCFYMKKSIPFVLPSWAVHDIDTLQDWQIAEFKYTFLQHKKRKKGA